MNLASAIAAVVLHEAAHIAMAWVLRVKIYRVGMSWRGPYIRRESGTDRQNLAISLAGSGVNLALALAMLHISPSFALNNLVLGIWNLLPFPASDGSRARQVLAGMRRNLPRSRQFSAECVPIGNDVISIRSDKVA
jgi:Zn-dependent protease